MDLMGAALIVLAAVPVLLLWRRRQRQPSLASASAHGSSVPLPAFDLQIAGHVGLSHEGGAIVVPEPGKIAKPVAQGDWAGEDQFYTHLSSTPALERFCPTYHGYRIISGRRFVVLQDLTHGLRAPCVVDIKLGTSTVAAKAPWAKRITHLAKDRETTTRSLGLRLIGAMHCSTEGRPSLKLGKTWGKAVRPLEMLTALRRVFSVNGCLCVDVLTHYVAALGQLLQVLEAQPCWQLISSSLLFVFEPHGAEPQMRMIDFAHSYKLEHCQKDFGYLFGLRNLRTMLQQLLHGGEEVRELPVCGSVPLLGGSASSSEKERDDTDCSSDTSHPLGHRHRTGRPGAAEDGRAYERRVKRRLRAAYASLAEGKRAGRVPLHLDELCEGLAHTPLSAYLPEWVGFGIAYDEHATRLHGIGGGAAAASLARAADDERRADGLRRRPAAEAGTGDADAAGEGSGGGLRRRRSAAAAKGGAEPDEGQRCKDDIDFGGLHKLVHVRCRLRAFSSPRILTLRIAGVSRSSATCRPVLLSWSDGSLESAECAGVWLAESSRGGRAASPASSAGGADLLSRPDELVLLLNGFTRSESAQRGLHLVSLLAEQLGELVSVLRRGSHFQFAGSVVLLVFEATPPEQPCRSPADTSSGTPPRVLLSCLETPSMTSAEPFDEAYVNTLELLRAALLEYATHRQPEEPG